jgi:transcriptional regulator with XRE-family HTH domain
MNDLAEILRKELPRSEEYRYAYDEEFGNTRVATQIKVLRESHDPPLTQKQLAEKAGMKQSRISELENVSYSSWSISTLRRLAKALGVRISFQFESWGELLPEVEEFGRSALDRPRLETDPAFAPEVANWANRLKREQALANFPRARRRRRPHPFRLINGANKCVPSPQRRLWPTMKQGVEGPDVVEVTKEAEAESASTLQEQAWMTKKSRLREGLAAYAAS